MRKKENANKKWIVKTFRLKPEIIFLYNFLEFYMPYKYDISKDELFDILVRESLKYIVDNDIKIIRKNERTNRIVKGLSMKESTMYSLDNLFNEYMDLYKATVIEFLISLYFKNNIKKKDLDPFISLFK